jgi:hypothetical protein
MKVMKDKTTGAMSLLLTAAAFAGAASPAHAQDTTVATPPTTTATTATTMTAAPDPDAWRFGVTIPGWAPKINGDVTIRGRQENVDVSFSDLKDHLRVSYGLAADAHKGKFGLYADGGYMRFFAGNGEASGTLKFGLVDAGMSYQLVKAGKEHPFILAATAGVRYWYLESDASFNLPLGGSVHGHRVWSLVDPVIGLQGSQYLARKFHLDFAADIGGFDINNDTDITWSATGVLTYDFTKCFSVSAGYKALALDESKGSGNTKDGVNLIFNGPVIAARFEF